MGHAGRGTELRAHAGGVAGAGRGAARALAQKPAPAQPPAQAPGCRNCMIRTAVLPAAMGGTPAAAAQGGEDSQTAQCSLGMFGAHTRRLR